MSAARATLGETAFEVAFAEGRALTPELEAAILAGIVEGGSLRSLSRRPDMPCARTLYDWMARAPAFARAVHRASDLREDNLNDQMLDIALRHGPYGLAVTKREAAPLQLRVNQLAKRPGWKRRRDERAGS